MSFGQTLRLAEHHVREGVHMNDETIGERAANWGWLTTRLILEILARAKEGTAVLDREAPQFTKPPKVPVGGGIHDPA